MGGEGLIHGSNRSVACVDTSVPISTDYPIDTWGTDEYEGIYNLTSFCNNGTWNRFEKLKCFTKKQVRQLKLLIKKEKEHSGLYNLTTSIEYKWIDAGGISTLSKYGARFKACQEND